MIERFCAGSGETDRVAELTDKLQDAFHFKVEDYLVADVLPKVRAPILIVHDENDEEIPMEDARRMKAARPDATLVCTRGSGHQMILVSRNMFRSLTEFLSA
jgi:pimeloyl-ACP methyl ester carboxylesterase